MQHTGLILTTIACAILSLNRTPQMYAQAGTDHFTINIPQKLAPGSPTPPPIDSNTSILQIGRVVATVSVSHCSPQPCSPQAITFTFTDQGNNSRCIGPSPGINGIACDSSTANFPVGSDVSGIGDTILMMPNSDPYQYQFNLELLSNFNSNSCAGTQTGSTDIYRVQISSTAAPAPVITAVCLESFDGHFPSGPVWANSCTNLPGHPNYGLHEIPFLPDPTARSGDVVATATVDKDMDPIHHQPRAACYTARPAVDVVLVLDKSGSMITDTSSNLCNTPPCKRMDALHYAVNNFIQSWGRIPQSGDKVGVVLFDSNAAWWTDNLANSAAPLPPGLHSVAGVSSIITQNLNSTNCPSAASCGTLVPGALTSIGAGLQLANDSVNGLQASGDSNRHVILLMSDGIQNTAPMVSASTITPATIKIGTSSFPLPPAGPQIYTVTLGPSTGPAAINQAIATASQGFYLNTEDHPDLLSPFFLELLQNFIRFNSYETVRLVSGNTPQSLSVPITVTSHDLELSLMWPQRSGRLRLTLTPPGGAQPVVKESDSGFIFLSQQLPLPLPFNPNDDWKIAIDLVKNATNSNQAGVPFDLHIMTEDVGIKSDLSIVPADYKPGGKIKLQAKLTQFGHPILGLGLKPGDRIEAELVRPEESVGDLLSDSDASATPQPCPSTGPCDKQSPAEAKLANMLKENPSALVHTSEIVRLFDDGNKSEHGDDVAGDGIYSALYPADLPGHYNFLIAAERTDASGPRFSRQQLRTAYVRPFPDGSNTDLRATLVSKGTLQIIMTPRGVSGDQMGPGWANYFWFTAPGVTPFKANDNLDGSYTATLNFTGKPPKVSVHFENVLAAIGDSVTSNQLPQPLDSNNILVGNIPVLSRWAAFLDLGGAFPHSTFSSAFDPGVSLNAGLEYMATSHFSAEGIFGYHHFPGKIGGDLNVYQFSANAKVYLVPPQKFRPFLNGGIGAYKFSPGTGNFGGNFGGGVLYELTPRFGLQGSYNFHAVNTTGGATKFSAIQGGIRYVF